jgi:hypothetical protein
LPYTQYTIIICFNFDFFNPDATVVIRHGKLPHWRLEGVINFVTFRLADSLPQAKLESLRHEKELWFSSKAFFHWPGAASITSSVARNISLILRTTSGTILLAVSETVKRSALPFLRAKGDRFGVRKKAGRLTYSPI